MTKANWVTMIAVSLSWSAVVFLLTDRTYLACVLALIAFIVDCLDGFVARLLHQESDIGRLMDSFSDVVLFLLWPSLMYFRYFRLSDTFSVLVQMIFISAGVFRLSRFNSVGYIKLGKSGVAYPGLPVVYSFMVIIILLFLRHLVGPGLFFLLANTLILVQSALMPMRFPHPKPATGRLVTGLLALLLILLIYGQSYI